MDDVSKFLQDVKELNARRTEEDEARQRELDEKLQQEKRERQARRAERARSISPQKSSPANTPPPSSRHNTPHLTDDLRLSPAPHSPGSPRTRERARSHATASPEPQDRDSCGPAPRENHAPSPEAEERPHSMDAPASPSSGPQGPRTMSWQRRPPSQASDRSRSRPLSMVAAQNAARTSVSGPSEPSSATEPTFSKDQIAQSLGSKDPTWFRQTADRGLGSAAYRKNQVEDHDPDTMDMSSMRAQLPGMNRASPTEARHAANSKEEDEDHAKQRRLASPPSISNAPTLDPPFEKSPDGESSVDRSGSVASSGRTSPTRPVSPTKGMGGFVQSAMMKRSDSVKRWTVTSPPGLARVDSAASNRSSFVGGSRHARSQSRPQSMFRPQSSASPESSRPTSQHGTQEGTVDLDTTPKAKASPQLPPVDTSMKDDEDVISPPVSPSKTMDPRRWSPTKASWLETALNKPESPKPKPTPPTSNQPAWMVELNKAKAERAGNPGGHARPGSISSKHEVNIGGLMRSSPMGASATPSPGGLGGIYSPPASSGRRQVTGSISGGSLRGDSNKDSPIPEKPELKPKPKPKTGLEQESPSAEPEPAKRSSVASPPSATAAGKPKPETPPKKDFRANLRSRQPSGDNKASRDEGNQLQNIRGTLRRTKTQNYVAPDELKDNITRGKAALNVTSGPQPSQRKDEFKDAILKKKDDFQKAQSEGKGITRSSAPSAEEKPVPEGLARRGELSKSHIDRRDAAADYGIETSKKPREEVSRPASLTSQHDSADSVPTSSNKEPGPPGLYKEESAPARLQGRPGGGRLADRFNPGLAGMLARGPPPMATNGGKGKDESDSKPSAAPPAEPSAPGPQLTHMTKGRARGPRRKAPTSAPAAANQSNTTSTPTSTAQSPVRNDPPQQNVSPKKVETPFSPQARNPSLPNIKAETPAKETPVKSPHLRSPPPPTSPSSSLSQSIQAQVAARAASKTKPASAEPVRKPASESPRTPSSTKPVMSPSSQAIKAKPFNVSPVSTLRRTPSPEKAPVQTQETSAPVPEPLSPRKLDTKRMSKFTDHSNGGVPAEKESPKREPLRELRKQETAQPAGEVSPSKPGDASPSKPGNEISAMLDSFFGTLRPKREYRVDTAEILTNRPQTPKIRNSSAQMFQLFGDGKKMPVPPHNERVLFEGDMYVCSIEYANEAGKKVCEVYFWAGDDVPASTVEDAQLFASREARALGGKLVRIHQGKETSEFLQALGGIVITRRGSGNKYDSLAPSMLCGRRHLGSVVFDEVDLGPASLCAGFPFLITKQGKCYLWKGKGSGVDELSCARLIGMDLTLTGELLEVEDGSEPEGFWGDAFGSGAGGGSGSKPHSADHWRLKPNYEKYCGRLFCSDAASAQQIFEISPYSQADLSPSRVYVLDAFFEMYVIVGREAKSQSQFTSFRNALDFAQEYAILASGMEDRPFVPVSTVVLEGIPRDLKRVFRKWRDDASPTVMNQQQQKGGAGAGDGGAAGLKRGRSLRILPLTQALQALSE